MSTLDDTYDRLRHFLGALREFDDSLRVSLAEVRNRDAALDAQWQDEAARAYRRIFEPLAEVTEQYIMQDAPRFEDFIDQKIRQLDDFLHGR